jgi:CBS domain-containing protein
MMTYMLVVILHDLSRLPALLEAWRQIGVPGVTLTNTVGGIQAESFLDRIGLGKLFDHEDSQQRMLISIINDPELLERAISEADRIVDGFDRPHSGILFSIPVSHALGIRKRGAEEKDLEPDVWAEEVYKLERKTSVAQLVNIMDLNPVRVQADASLQEIAEEAIARPRVHVVCVVNREDRLIGVIDLSKLSDALFFSIFPEEFLGELKDIDQVMDYAGRTYIRQAEDLMREPVSVRMDDNLEKAFHLMHEKKLQGLPVIDDHYHIIGYINMLELMSLCLTQAGNREGKE